MIFDKKEERLRNANAYYRIKSMGLSFADCFKENDEIVIFGFSGLGRILCTDLILKRNIIGIIDNGIRKSEYRGIPICSLDEIKDNNFLAKHKEIVIVVTNTAFWDEIVDELWRILGEEAKVLPFCSLCAYLELDEFDKHNTGYKIIKKLVNGEGNGDIENVVIVNSIYSLLIYTLYNSSFAGTLFCIHTFIPDNNLLDMIERLGGVYVILGDYFDKEIYDVDLKVDILRAISFFTKKLDIHVYGQDYFPYVLDFIDSDLTLIEDGFVTAYTPAEHKKKYKNMYYALEEKVCFAHYPDIKKVLFIHDYEMPEEYRKKAIFIDLKEKWETLDCEKKEVILSGFGFSSAMEAKIKETHRRTLLIGSNYAGNALCDEKTEIQMFREVMANYDENDVIIKPHPMSKIDYQKVFPNSYVINTTFPIEILMFIDIGIQTIVGIVSNGLVNLRDIYIVKDYPEIKERYLEKT